MSVVTLHPSWLDISSLSAIYFAALLATACSGAPLVFTLPLLCMVTFRYIVFLKRWRNERNFVRQLVWHQSGKIEYFLLENAQLPDSHSANEPAWHGQKGAKTTDNGLVIILHVQQRNGAIEKVMVWRDAVSPTEYRQIRARIKLFQYAEQIH